MSPTELAGVITALGIGGGLTAIINAVMQRKKIGADATSVVIAAARELVDPLRKELAQERKEHSEEVAEERKQVTTLRTETASALAEAQQLRRELAACRQMADELREENFRFRSLLSANGLL